MSMVRHFAEFQQIPHPEALAGFPFVTVFVVFRKRDVIEGASALGDVLPDGGFDVSIAYMMEGFDFIHGVSLCLVGPRVLTLGFYET
jgi:hypothetical protein